MRDDPRVLIPFEYSLFFNVSIVIAIGLLIAALITLWALRSRMPGSDFIVWFIVILVVPWLGSIAWLAFGRRLAIDRYSSVTQARSAEGSRR